MPRFALALVPVCFAVSVFAQSPLDTLRELAVAKASKLDVTELRVRADPAPRVRPLETLVVQALIYGETETGELARIQSESIRFRIEGENAGRISKPFRYQGQEEEKFYQPTKSGLFGSVFQQGAMQYALQDSALYAAPEQEGTYTVIASADGVEAAIEIEVTAEAQSGTPAETVGFEPEPRDRDRYRLLAEHYAPFIAQETWFEPKYDYLARFDLDGDFRGDNNWENATGGSSQAYVYYTAVETDTHWFLIYNFFHARDYSDKCVIGTCHENDNEGLVLTVHKDGSRFGRVRAMETLAHNNVYSYAADREIGGKAHNIDGPLELHDGSHPMIFIEAGGHGVLGATDSHSYFDVESGGFRSGSGVTYVYGGEAERPEHPNDREVGYELLPMWEHWWLRAHEQPEDGMFDAYFSYRPVGARPVPRHAEIAGSFLGRAQSENKAKPFWGWHDNRTRKAGLLATGQWALDPAYSAQVDLDFPERFSVDYTYHPYLGIGSASRRASVATAVDRRAAAPAPSEEISAPRLGGSSFSGDQIAAPTIPGRGMPAARGGSIDYEATVAGEVILSIRGERVEVVTGAPQDPKTSFSGPLPAAGLGRLDLSARNGRAEVLAEPSRSNDYATILRVRPDGRRGKVRFRLEWGE